MDTRLLDGTEPLISASAPATGETFLTAKSGNVRSYQAAVAGTGAVSATIIVDISNDGVHWKPVHTFELSGTGSDSAETVSQHSWSYTRARVTAISGTDAVATCTVGV